jgi:hypothetical protein
MGGYDVAEWFATESFIVAQDQIAWSSCLARDRQVDRLFEKLRIDAHFRRNFVLPRGTRVVRGNGLLVFCWLRRNPEGIASQEKDKQGDVMKDHADPVADVRRIADRPAMMARTNSGLHDTWLKQAHHPKAPAGGLPARAREQDGQAAIPRSGETIQIHGAQEGDVQAGKGAQKTV